MDKKSRGNIRCPSCGAMNTDTTVCKECGRILQLKAGTPIDYKPIISLLIVLLILAASIVIGFLIHGNWDKIQAWFNGIVLWVKINKETVDTIIEVFLYIMIIFITAKITKSKDFTTIYGVSLIVLCIVYYIDETRIGENPFEAGVIRTILSLLIMNALLSFILWVGRKIE